MEKLSKVAKTKKIKKNKNKEDTNEINNEDNNNLKLNEESDNENKNLNISKTDNDEIDQNEGYKVFINGIPYDTPEDEIKNIFKDCGKIVDIKIPKYQDSGRNRGYGFITFDKSKSVKNALLKDKTYLGSRYITVEEGKGSKDSEYQRKADIMDIPENCKIIIIKNLSYDLTEKELGDKFRGCGDINSIRMVCHPKLNHFKGFAFIEFCKTESVKLALNFNGKEFKGRKMLIDFEESGPKSSFKFRNEDHSKYNREFLGLQKKYAKLKSSN